MKLKIRCKILVNGLFPMKNFKIDEFIQKTGSYDESKINVEDEDYIFYVSDRLVKSMYSVKGIKGCFYEYLENEELIEVDVEKEISKNKDLIRNFALDYCFGKIAILERKLRLITNITIGLPVFRANLYDEDGNKLEHIGGICGKTSNLNINEYTESMKEILSERLRLNITQETLEELEKTNSRYKRAMTFYNESFFAEDIEIKFVLLFSALESLFNFDPDKVTEYVAKYSSKCLFLDEKKEKKYYFKIKDFYDRRSSYIHGNEPKEIGKEREFQLREIVRKILLIYWNISLVNKIESAENFLEYLDANNKDSIELISQIFIKSLEIKEYSEFYENIKKDLQENNSIL